MENEVLTSKMLMTSEGIEKKVVRRVDKMNKRLKRGGENWLHKKESGFSVSL